MITYPFGPAIYSVDISGEFHEFLLDGLEDCRKAQDATRKLVGNIDQQRYTLYDPKRFTGFIHQHLVRYLQERNDRHNSVKEICFVNPTTWKEGSVLEYTLGVGPWVNFQKKGEFNPLHNHSGVISAVVFIKIPTDLDEERRNSNYTSKAAGCLEFVHNNQHIVVKPREAMMYLFPSYLHHVVYPYTSDVERVSMSFNIHDVTINGIPLPPHDNILFYEDQLL
tara:strand:+ start:61 stop:729 length:669 start_codon:yes stop_codon:yes gene_type:complete